MTRINYRRHDDFTTTPEQAASHARRHAPDPEPPETITAADVAPMTDMPTCVDCGGMVVFSIQPGVWSECRDCERPSRMAGDVRQAGAA